MENLTIEIVKTDLKNVFEAPNMDRVTKLATLNDALKWLTLLEDEAVDKVIREYREEQKKQEDVFLKSQNDMWKNAENIYNHLMKEL